jgi:hypothetical protein
VKPWWRDVDQIMDRMLAWKGKGPPPNYLAWAWQESSPSLLKVAPELPEDRADDLVYHAFMTRGERAIARVDVVLDLLEARYPETA